MNKFTFISVPRTATNSMHTALLTGFKYNHYSARDVYLEGFSFGFIRNPFEQIYSWYSHHKLSQPHLIEYQCSFNEWVVMGCKTHWDAEVCKSLGISHPCQQSDYLTDKDGNIIVDFIGCYDRIKEDWSYICKTLEIEKELPYINYSRNPNILINAMNHYNQQSIEKVKELFKPTLKLYKNVL